MLKSTKVFTAAAIALSASVLAIPAANAGPNNGSCETGEACVWNGGQYTLGMADMAATDPNWHNNRFNAGAGAIVGDEAQSGGANGAGIVFFRDINYGGPFFVLGANNWDGGFANGIGNAANVAGDSPGQDWANRISSSGRYIAF